MIEVSRNFISLDKIKDTVRALGYNKMNVLHLHLSDSASFPVWTPSETNLTRCDKNNKNYTDNYDYNYYCNCSNNSNNINNDT